MAQRRSGSDLRAAESETGAGYVVPARLVECPYALGHGEAGGALWGEPDPAGLRRALRSVVEDYGEALRRARVGRALITGRCSPAVVAAAIGDALVRPLLLGPGLAECSSAGCFEAVD